MDNPSSRASSQEGGTPPLRLKLATLEDVRKELARLYREGKSGRRDVVEVSRLANVLQILGRSIADSDLEHRIKALEGDK